jgi:3-dehydroquinate dehydratase-2
MADNSSRKKILVVHGPNLNMLGKREPQLYGHQSLAEIDDQLTKLGTKLELDVKTFQSNHEGVIVDAIQQAMGAYHGIIINPAAYTHTSIAIRDALAMLDVPVIEIHISNINQREPFRHRSMIADVVTARIVGFGSHGYLLALEGLAKMISGRSLIQFHLTSPSG